MAQINALRTPAAHRSPSAHGQEDFRLCAQIKFILPGVLVWQKGVLFVHAISRTCFKNLCDSVGNHGVIDRVHGNARKRPHNAFSYSSIENASRFIVNTSDTHGLPLPGCLPTCEHKVVVLLVSNKAYKEKCFLQGMAGPTRQYRYNEACHRLMLRMPTVYDTNCTIGSSK